VAASRDRPRPRPPGVRRESGQDLSRCPRAAAGARQGRRPDRHISRPQHRVDLSKGLDDDPQELARLIAGAQGQAIDAAAAGKLLAGLSPYRGLLPFREQDAGLFFGRKRFVDELVRKVGRRTPTNVVAVIGRSGSGKSSIVYAGLFPALRRERGVGGDSVWQIVDLRLNAEPLQQLAAAFDPPKAELGLTERIAALNAKSELLRNRQLTLAQLVRYRLQADRGSTRLLLYVDQWEELYTLATPRELKSDQDRTRAADAKLFIDFCSRSGRRLALHARLERPFGFLSGHPEPRRPPRRGCKTSR
jgi:hypothetical protein